MVTNPDGKSDSLSDGFAVVATQTAPRVTGITPASGNGIVDGPEPDGTGQNKAMVLVRESTSWDAQQADDGSIECIYTTEVHKETYVLKNGKLVLTGSDLLSSTREKVTR